LKLGKKLCVKCGTNVSALTRKPAKEEAPAPVKVVSSKDVGKVWDKVLSADQPIVTGSVPTKASVLTKAKIESSPSSSAPQAAAVVAPKPMGPLVAAPVAAAPAVIQTGSNVQAKEAMGLKRCDYCTKFCYDGEGELLGGKLYHVSYCLAKATALLKFAAEETEVKQQPPKKTSQAIDPIINEILKTEEAYIRGEEEKEGFFLFFFLFCRSGIDFATFCFALSRVECSYRGRCEDCVL
jgi:hypothetical protein